MNPKGSFWILLQAHILNYLRKLFVSTNQDSQRLQAEAIENQTEKPPYDVYSKRDRDD